MWFLLTGASWKNIASWGRCVSCLHPSQGGLRLPSTSVSTWYSMSASVCSMTAPQPISLIWASGKTHALKHKSQEICAAQKVVSTDLPAGTSGLSGDV